jgi:hypothetical protein
MLIRSLLRTAPLCWCVFLLSPLGCTRSAAVVGPDSIAQSDEATAAKSSDPARGNGAFVFPDDAAGRLLAKELAPKESDALHLPRPEVARASVASLKMPPPDLPLPPSHPAIPHLPGSANPSLLRPRLVLEESLDGLPTDPSLPQTQTLPEGLRMRVSSDDSHEPLALPILAQPALDRASLDDPTADASTTSALSRPIPPRLSRAPFLRLSLPDPYDYRRGSTPALPENTEPPLATPRTPGR